jgi:hypothetical protein
MKKRQAKDLPRVTPIVDALQHEGVATGVARRFSAAHRRRFERFERWLKYQVATMPHNHKGWVRRMDRILRRAHADALLIGPAAKPRLQIPDGRTYDARMIRILEPEGNQRCRCVKLLSVEPRAHLEGAWFDGGLVVTKHATERMVINFRIQHDRDFRLMIGLVFDDYLDFRKEVTDMLQADGYHGDRLTGAFAEIMRGHPHYSMQLEPSPRWNNQGHEIHAMAEVDPETLDVTHYVTTVIPDD